MSNARSSPSASNSVVHVVIDSSTVIVGTRTFDNAPALHGLKLLLVVENLLWTALLAKWL